MAQKQHTSGERALELIRLLLPDWPPTTQEVVRWVRIALAVGIVILSVLLILDVVSSIFDIKLWNLLKILAVPLTVGAAVPWLNWAQKKRELETQATQKERDLEVADRQAEDAALHAYIDKMENMLNEHRHLSYQALVARREGGSTQQQALDEYQQALRDYENENNELQRRLPKYREWQKNPNPRPPDWKGHWLNPEYAEDLERDHKKKVEDRRVDLKSAEKKVAEEPQYALVKHAELILEDKNTLMRAQTLAVLDQVRERHKKRSIMRFLSESKLTRTDNPIHIPLDDADFSSADLTGMALSNSNLNGARLTEANLSGSRLFEANLQDADLTGSRLFDTNLQNADLERANLERADLSGADLSGANLRYAEGVTEDRLERQAFSLEGTTMPKGSKHP